MPSRKPAIYLLLAAMSDFPSQVTAASCDTHAERPAASDRYVIKGPEVYDNTTDLTWQRCSIGQYWKDRAGCIGNAQHYNWNDTSALGSTSGWRLPTLNELSTLVSPTCKPPAIDETIFPNTDTGIGYWTNIIGTGTGPLADTPFAWAVIFKDGSADQYPTSHLGAIRLVRSGK